MNKKTSYFLILVLAILNLAGVVGPDLAKLIIGKWERDNLRETWEFTNDGKVSVTTLWGANQGKTETTKFIIVDNNHIKLGGRTVFEASVSNEELKMKHPATGTVTYYKGKKAVENRKNHFQQLKRNLVGKWKEVDRAEILEFFQDGKVTATEGTQSMDGKYSFLDMNTIKIKWGGKGGTPEPLELIFV